MLNLEMYFTVELGLWFFWGSRTTQTAETKCYFWQNGTEAWVTSLVFKWKGQFP